MKALDTGVLLALLEGSTRARDLLRKLRGIELATTEANLLELGYLAGAAPAKARKGRLAALEKLRQRLTVLEINARSTREATNRLAKGTGPVSLPAAAMLGALQAAGCEELLTDEPRTVSGDWGVRVRAVRV